MDLRFLHADRKDSDQTGPMPRLISVFPGRKCHFVGFVCCSSQLSQLMRLWYLSHRRPAKAQASLHICTVSPEPSLFTYMKYGSGRRVRWNIRHPAPLDGCAGVIEEWVYVEKIAIISRHGSTVILSVQRDHFSASRMRLAVAFDWALIGRLLRSIFSWVRSFVIWAMSWDYKWHFSSSVNSFLKRTCTAIQWG